MRMFLLAALGALALPAFALPPCGATSVYTACDVSFDLPAPSGPLNVFVEFRAPDYKTFRFPAFYDGSGHVVARLTPTQPGKWTYRVSGDSAALNGKQDQFQVAAGDALPFIKRSNVHHWEHTEGLKPHFFASAWFTTPEDLDAWATLGITHLAVRIPLTTDPKPLEETAARIAAINSKRMLADLVLAPSAEDLAKAFPERVQRELYTRLLIAHFSAFNITWQLVERWEGYVGARDLLKAVGLQIKQLDPYNHPRTTRAARASNALGPDGWMDFTCDGPFDNTLTSIGHQLNTVPQLALVDSTLPPAEFRKRLWNTATSGAYIALTAPIAPGSENARTFGGFAQFFQKRTRFWDIEPFFDLDGARALAIPGQKDEDGYNEYQSVEYIAYIDTPGPIEIRVQKHSYDVYWVNPATGDATKEKKDWKGDVWQGEPPDKSHDWVLHLSRDGRKEGMLKSYKFESWPVPVQEPEREASKAPFELVTPAATDVLTVGVPIEFSIRLKRKSGGTRRMMYLLTGEVVRDGQAARVLAVGQSGSFTIPAEMLTAPDGHMNVRLAALNAAGKLYMLDYVFTVKVRQ